MRCASRTKPRHKFRPRGAPLVKADSGDAAPKASPKARDGSQLLLGPRRAARPPTPRSLRLPPCSAADSARVVRGACRLAQHVEREAIALLRLVLGIGERLVDGLAEHELPPRMRIAWRSAWRITGLAASARSASAPCRRDRVAALAPIDEMPRSIRPQVEALTSSELDWPRWRAQSPEPIVPAISRSAVAASGMRSRASARQSSNTPSSLDSPVFVQEANRRRLLAPSVACRFDSRSPAARSRGAPCRLRAPWRSGLDQRAPLRRASAAPIASRLGNAGAAPISRFGSTMEQALPLWPGSLPHAGALWSRALRRGSHDQPSLPRSGPSRICAAASPSGARRERPSRSFPPWARSHEGHLVTGQPRQEQRRAA